MKKRYANDIEAMYGEEPKPPVDVASDSETFKNYLRDALHYYTYASSNGQKKEWFLDWTNEHKERLSLINDSFFTVAGALARISSLGVKVEEQESKLQSFLDKFLDYAEDLWEDKQKKLKTRQAKKDRKDEQEFLQYFEVFEYTIDEIVTGSKKKFDFLEWIRNEKVPTRFQWELKSRAESLLTEIESQEEDFVEGYSNLSKSVKKNLIESLSVFHEEIPVKVKTVSKKPRKKRKVNPDIKVKNLHYKKKGSEDPKKVLGASVVILYNEKYRTLTALVSASDDGLTIKGTSIHGWDEEKSYRKKLRKPEETLSKIANEPKTRIKKLVDELTTQYMAVNGRVNEDTVIVKIFK